LFANRVGCRKIALATARDPFGQQPLGFFFVR
jgi:hypothetical protein